MAELKVKTLNEIADGILLTRRVIEGRTIPNPDTAEGSEAWLDAQSVAQAILGINYLVLTASEAAVPDSATGPDLDRHAAVFGLTRRGARVSSGSIVFASNGSSLVAAETELTDPSGNIFFVTGGGTFANGEEIQISAREGGFQNLPAGTVLKWKDIPAGALKSSPVAPGGLTGGAPGENDVSLRQRISDRLSNPANAGNWQDLKTLIEESTADVHGWIYQAANGPGTVHCAVSRSPTATNFGRDVDSVVMETEIKPHVEGLYPAHNALLITNVNNQPTDVSIGLSLRASDGWKDSIPFPQTATYADVLSVTSDIQFRVNSTVPPTAGKRVAWIDSNFKLHRATIRLFELVFSYWLITIDAPFTGIVAGDWVFPDFGQAELVLQAALSAFAGLGPGQKVTAPGLLPTALRQPLVTQSNPANLTSAFLRQLTLGAESVQDGDWLYRSSSAPSVPAIVTDPPNILTPRKLAFYPSSE